MFIQTHLYSDESQLRHARARQGWAAAVDEQLSHPPYSGCRYSHHRRCERGCRRRTLAVEGPRFGEVAEMTTRNDYQRGRRYREAPYYGDGAPADAATYSSYSDNGVPDVAERYHYSP